MQIENLITEHIDTWTSAIKQKSATGRGSSKKIELYGIKKLRELILELAVRGKLVPQDENDEPASVLLERIAEEKAQLVKDKKIKKPKKLPLLEEVDKPISLPTGWDWAYFGDICEIERGGSPRPIKSFLTDSPSGLNWIKIGDTDIGGKYITQTAEKIRPEGLKKTRQVYPGDFLLTNSMSFGRPYITMIEGCIHDGWLRISPPKSIDKDYLYNLLSSPYITRSFKNSASGAVVMNLNADKVKETIIAVPPTAEQHRIVAKVDELMLLCDQLEQQTESSIDAHKTLVEVLLNTLTDAKDTTELQTNWARVSEFFDTLFTTEHSIDQLKQTILQLAVMGKLVPQDPSDEPASTLLARIAAEKAQLIADKKIKKQKALPPITDEEKPFEVPSGWKWVCWWEILAYDDAAFKRGPFGSSLTKSMFINEGYKVYEQYCPINDDCSFERYYISEEKFEELKGFSVKAGDFLVSCTGATLGRITQVPIDFNEGIINQALLRVRVNLEFIDSDFFKLLFRSPFFQKNIFANSKGSAIPNVKGVKDLKVMQVPFLPIMEQRRIVRKVTQLMKICDQLKSQLNQAQQTQLNLTDALVAQVV